MWMWIAGGCVCYVWCMCVCERWGVYVCVCVVSQCECMCLCMGVCVCMCVVWMWMWIANRCVPTKPLVQTMVTQYYNSEGDRVSDTSFTSLIPRLQVCTWVWVWGLEMRPLTHLHSVHIYKLETPHNQLNAQDVIKVRDCCRSCRIILVMDSQLHVSICHHTWTCHDWMSSN